MIIHTVSQIGNVLRNAVVFDFKNSREKMVSAELLPKQVESLFQLFDERKADFVLVNGLALLTYIEGRNTQDIDLIMALPSLQKLPEIKIISQDMYFTRGQFDELQIDILLTRNPLFEKVAKQYATEKQFKDRQIHCATVEGLLLLKLYALPLLYRQGSFERVGIYENDVATLLFAYQPDMQLILTEIGKHLNETDMAEVRNILTEIEERIKKFKRRN